MSGKFHMAGEFRMFVCSSSYPILSACNLFFMFYNDSVDRPL